MQIVGRVGGRVCHHDGVGHIETVVVTHETSIPLSV